MIKRLSGPAALIVAGLGAGLGQAPWNLWYVAVPAYVLGLALLARTRRPFFAGWLFGTAHFALVLHWIVEPFLVDPVATGWMAPIAIAAMAGGLALFWAAAAFVGRLTRAGPVGIALALLLAELARSYVATGFPWALPGHVFIGSSALASASVLGAHGMGLCLLLGAGLLAIRRAVPALAGVALLGLPFAVAATLSPAPQAGADAPIVRLVQPNAPQHLKWDPAWIETYFGRGLAASAAAPAGPEPVTIVWPETSLPDLLERSEGARARIAGAAGGVPVVIGAQRYGPDLAPRNSVVVLTGAEGAITEVHDKHRLVPFGEYLPLPQVAEALGIGPLAAQLAGTYAPGNGPVLIDVPGLGPVLPMICYEAIFPQDVRRVARPRAILHLTNDAWFGTFAGPRQHLALARLRAAESGLPLLRAANTGVTASIDARGRVLSSLALGETGHLDVALPPALQATLYAISGDRPAAVIVVLGLVAVAAVARRRKPVAAPGNRV